MKDPRTLTDEEIKAIELALIPSKDRSDAGMSFEDSYTVIADKDQTIRNLIATVRHWKNQFDILDEECTRLESLE